MGRDGTPPPSKIFGSAAVTYLIARQFGGKSSSVTIRLINQSPGGLTAAAAAAAAAA